MSVQIKDFTNLVQEIENIINDYVSKIGNISSDSVDMKRLKLVD